MKGEHLGNGDAPFWIRWVDRITQRDGIGVHHVSEGDLGEPGTVTTVIAQQLKPDVARTPQRPRGRKIDPYRQHHFR